MRMPNVVVDLKIVADGQRVLELGSRRESYPHRTRVPPCGHDQRNLLWIVGSVRKDGRDLIFVRGSVAEPDAVPFPAVERITTHIDTG